MRDTDIPPPIVRRTASSINSTSGTIVPLNHHKQKNLEVEPADEAVVPVQGRTKLQHRGGSKLPRVRTNDGGRYCQRCVVRLTVAGWLDTRHPQQQYCSREEVSRAG